MSALEDVPRGERARTLPELIRAYASVWTVPKQTKGESLNSVWWLLSIVVGSAVALPVVVVLYSPIELVVAPTSAIATVWFLTAAALTCKFVAFPVADRVAGITRIRGVAVE